MSTSHFLVTGGAGYVGSVVAAHLLEAGHRVTVLDDLSTGFADAVPPGAEFVAGRVQDTAARLLSDRSAPPVDGVLHFAASSQVGESVADPEKYWRNNVAGSLELVSAMRAAGVRRLVFSSTAAVYGEPERTPIREDARTAPTSPYGATKLAVDHLLTGEAAAHGLAAVSLRYFNVAGAYGSWGERHEPESHLIPLVLGAALGEREHIAVYGEDWSTPDGTCVRDYLHVADLARAHLLALDAAVPGEHLICNLGNGNGFSVLEVIEAVRRVTGRAVPVVGAPRRAGDPAQLVASADLAQQRLGWRPEHTGLDEIVATAWEFTLRRRAAADRAALPGDTRPGAGNGTDDGPGPAADARPRQGPDHSGNERERGAP
ncbi:UDP-glucose 4-epimerase GalE [Streptomyces sp. XM4193]|uniref:UDP-glucose 4-epimerase GalE n=1 Tax=Streptomyces sp. XM4193 TaxID=2929782 RepID=UPI001FF93F05|nr:UDP-glucose 4-epimerase GalE [Streptomyces sp. XM4193]MCK1795289.1 UDP-glucose 4-epimerase GalE [Streptomyces sp. XM4193]